MLNELVSIAQQLNHKDLLRVLLSSIPFYHCNGVPDTLKLQQRILSVSRCSLALLESSGRGDSGDTLAGLLEVALDHCLAVCVESTITGLSLQRLLQLTSTLISRVVVQPHHCMALAWLLMNNSTHPQVTTRLIAISEPDNLIVSLTTSFYSFRAFQ